MLMRSSFKRYGRYGEMTAADWGSGVGSTIGAGLRTFFPNLTTDPNDQQIAMTRYVDEGTWVQPSWWSQQTTGTKILIGGAVFMIGAVGLVTLRAKLKR